jgi:hypothetical protein
MKKENLVIEAPLAFAGITLLAITRCHLDYRQKGRVFFIFGSKKPVNIVVLSNHGQQAFDISGEEVSLERLMDEIPSLKKTLESLISF